MKKHCLQLIMAASVTGSMVCADEESLAELVSGNREFAAVLYKSLASPGGNLFFSPYSISTALAMTYAGAREETEVQMAEVMRFHFGSKIISPIFGELQRTLAQAQGDGVELLVANSLWPDQTYDFEQDYLDLIEKHFASEVNLVDYNEPEAVRAQINTWVEDMTREKIKDLIPAGALNPLTRMVLANAVYFKGKWQDEFKTESTADLPFNVEDGEPVNTPMMRGKFKTSYGVADGVQLLELPYIGKSMSMLLALPPAGTKLSDLDDKLSHNIFADWEQALAETEVIITIPKFKMTAEFSLSQALKRMGMTDAFDPGKADFSGMDGLINNLFISEILHKAFVDVSEEGTEAAAATAIIMRTTSMRLDEPPEFTADRPFLFFIKDSATGSILFMGRYATPPES
jgi:serpin B